jgi:hypothetical protein
MFMSLPSGREGVTELLARIAAVEDLLMDWPATAAALTDVRSCVKDWLCEHRWPQDATRGIVHAVTKLPPTWSSTPTPAARSPGASSCMRGSTVIPP